MHKKFDNGAAWNRAMDEVRVERWEKRYKERTLEVMIKYWPDTDKYKDRPELIASLEHQVRCVPSHPPPPPPTPQIQTDISKSTCFEAMGDSVVLFIKSNVTRFAMRFHDVWPLIYSSRLRIREYK